MLYKVKKIITLIIIAFLFYSCKKNSQEAPPIKNTGLSGIYKLFKIEDTIYAFTDTGTIDHIQEVISENASGDTAYFNIGTPQYYVSPNPIVGYLPSYNLNIILNFTSATTGTKSNYGQTPYGFIYSIPKDTLTFTTNYPDPGGIIKLSPNTIELTTQQFSSNGLRAGGAGGFFEKE